MTTSILSTPPELVLRIFECASDFHTLIALASTCKYINKVWQTHSSEILWEVGLTCIPAFNEALIATRATQIVVLAQAAGTLPPTPFPVNELSGLSKKPKIAEMKDVLKTQYFCLSVEAQILHRNLKSWAWARSNGSFHRGGGPPSDSYAVWRERFLRSIHHVTIAGAVGWGAYHAPFAVARSEGGGGSPLGFFERCQGEEALTPEDAQFLHTFPIYAFHLHEDTPEGMARDVELERAFAPFAEWMIAEGDRRGVRDGISTGSDGDLSGALREILGMICIHEHYYDRAFKRAFICDGPVESATVDLAVVLFGTFMIHHLQIPVSNTLQPQIAAPPSPQINIRRLLQKLRARAPIGPRKCAAPQFELFTWIVRRYFGLGWQSSAFNVLWYRRPYVGRLSKTNMWQVGEDDGMAKLPTDVHDVPRLTRERSCVVS